ncbi:MAG TPA: hypothetical protein VF221_02540, partial [Chloroflexota bacterium]
ESHMQLHAYSTEWSDGALRRLCLRLGPLLDDAIMLARADAAGHTVDGRSANAPKFNELERRVAQIDREGVGELKSPLNGDDLMSRYNRPPGPWIRTVKSRLMDEVFEGRLRPDDTEAAWRIADELIAG